MSIKITNQLKESGLKITQPRIKILDFFYNSSKKHHSTEEVFESLKSEGTNVGIATVYRVISQLEASGLILRLQLGRDYNVYELNDGKPHDHIICIKCHNVSEFNDPIIKERQENIIKSQGSKLINHHTVLYITCNKCISSK